MVCVLGSRDPAGTNREASFLSRDIFHFFVLSHINTAMLHNPAVVSESLTPCRFRIWNREGHASDFEQYCCTEEGHVVGVANERITDASLLYQHARKPSLFGCSADRDTTRSRSYNDYVVLLSHVG
jgi:hypothetical protein